MCTLRMELVQMQETTYRWEVCNSEKGSHLTLLLPLSCTSSLRNCEKYISDVCKQLCAWYFVIAAQMDRQIDMQIDTHAH